jgi:hypothetical protein
MKLFVIQDGVDHYVMSKHAEGIAVIMVHASMALAIVIINGEEVVVKCHSARMSVHSKANAQLKGVYVKRGSEEKTAASDMWFMAE